MSGRRCRALKKHFAERAKRPVSTRTRLLGYNLGAVSEWRQLKKLWHKVKAR